MKYWEWPPYYWQPHQFCNILCFVFESAEIAFESAKIAFESAGLLF